MIVPEKCVLLSTWCKSLSVPSWNHKIKQHFSNDEDCSFSLQLLHILHLRSILRHGLIDEKSGKPNL